MKQHVRSIDSGAPLISDMDRVRKYFDVNGILSDVDNEMNPGVFAYVQYPDNFEFINNHVWKEEVSTGWFGQTRNLRRIPGTPIMSNQSFLSWLNIPK